METNTEHAQEVAEISQDSTRRPAKWTKKKKNHLFASQKTEFPRSSNPIWHNMNLIGVTYIRAYKL